VKRDRKGELKSSDECRVEFHQMLRRLIDKLARADCLPRHIADDAVRQRRRDRPPQADLQTFVAARADLVAQER
jgi:hypothetical protein